MVQAEGRRGHGGDFSSAVRLYIDILTGHACKHGRQAPFDHRPLTRCDCILQVIEVLKKRGEKGGMLLAMNEMGDVHAHFGNWSAATTAWNDTLDTLIGPYQVRSPEHRKCFGYTWIQPKTYQLFQ